MLMRQNRKIRLLAILLMLSLLFVTGCAGQQTDESIDSTPSGEYSIINMNDEEEHEGLLMGVAIPNYLLYGYHVLNSGYIHTVDVKDHPILDESKMEAKFYKESTDKGSDVYYSSSSRMSDFYSKFNATVSADYKGVAFSGSITSEFGVEKQTSEKQMFIRFIQYHTLFSRTFIGETEDLVGMLTDRFKADLIKYKDAPEKIFEKYGTHLITKYYLGGRADLNFTFTNNSSSSAETIRASVDAAYGRVSGSATAEDEEKSKLVLENSTLSLKTYGGDFVSGNTVGALAQAFPAWAKSIESSPNICRIGNFNDSMLPIWELVADKTIAKALEDEFDRQAQSKTLFLGDLDYVATPQQKYITDIVVLSADDKDEALAKKPEGYELVCLNPGSKSTSPLECNKDAGGAWIYIAYKTDSDVTKAITDIYVSTGKNTTYPSFHKITQDLNKDAGGDYIYLFYRKATKSEQKDLKTQYLREIRGFYGKSNTLPIGWRWPSINVDLNKGAGGEYIYLAVKKN